MLHVAQLRVHRGAEALRDGGEEVSRVGGALDFIRAVLVDQIEAVLGVSREMVDHWVRGVGEVLGRRQVDGLFGRMFFRHAISPRA